MSNAKTQFSGRASLAKALCKGFRAAYDNLGYVVFVTFTGFVISAAISAGVILIANATKLGPIVVVLFLPVGVVGWLIAVGVFYYANKSVYYEYPVLADTWNGIRILFWPALKLFALDLVVTAVFLVDASFFLMIKGGLVFRILGVVCGYFLLVWLMMLMYHLPLLVVQLGMESGPRAFVVVRKSFLLTADNPGFTVGLFVVIIALAIICALPAFIGTAVFFLGAAAFVLTHALRELFVKYGIVEEEPEVIKDDGWPTEC